MKTAGEKKQSRHGYWWKSGSAGVIALALAGMILVDTGWGQPDAFAAEATHDVAVAARKAQLEGARLQLQGDLTGAIAKYRESIALQPNERLTNLIKQLEGQTGNQGAAIPVPEQAGKKTAASQAAPPIAAAVQQSAAVPSTASEHPAPASSEEELIYGYTDWLLDWLPAQKNKKTFSVQTNRKYSITPKDGRYEVVLQPFVVNLFEDVDIDLQSLVITYKPTGVDTVDFSFQLPDKAPVLVKGKPLGELSLGAQEIRGSWNKKLQTHPEFVATLHDLRFAAKEQFQAMVKEVKIHSNYTGQEQGPWSGGAHGLLSQLSFTTGADSFGIDEIELEAKGDGQHAEAIRQLMEQSKKVNKALLAADSDTPNLAEFKSLFESYDLLYEMYDNFTYSCAIKGIKGISGPGKIFLPSLALNGVMHKNPQTQQMEYQSALDLRDFSVVQKTSTAENAAPPVTVSLEHMGMAGKGQIKPLPPKLFSTLYASLADLEANPGEGDPQKAGAAALVFVRDILALIQGYSGELAVESLRVENVMPKPVSLEKAHIKYGFDVGAGEGGSFQTVVGFTGFEGLDMGSNNIPQAANLHLNLSQIPSLLTLIPDAKTMEQADLAQLKGQLGLQAANTLMGSHMALTVSDTYIDFPTSKFSLSFQGNVDNTAKFMSVGELHLSVENPDEFARIVKTFGGNQDAAKVLAMVTALANREDAGGKVTDKIAAKVGPDGKVMVNNKDVTAMFLPNENSGPPQEGGQPASQADEPASAAPPAQ